MEKCLTEQEEFIRCLKTIKSEWLSSEKTTEEVVDGVLFSLLVMIDGDSTINDFHALNITDSETGNRIDCGYLHELYYKI
ncbi:MAG: hypothetical protein ACI4DY_00790 [Monoglobaceae bacterium]